VLDSDGRPVPSTLIEIWQTNASGAYRTPVATISGPSIELSALWSRHGSSPGSASKLTT